MDLEVEESLLHFQVCLAYIGVSDEGHAGVCIDGNMKAKQTDKDMAKSIESALLLCSTLLWYMLCVTSDVTIVVSSCMTCLLKFLINVVLSWQVN